MVEDSAVVAAATAGDDTAFTELAERYRRELQVHCYRMLGSVEESEDLVQETFLRAWRRRETYQGRATFRAWLYRIATNACLDTLDRRPAARQAMPAGDGPVPAVAVPWLQPYPDDLLAGLPSADESPDTAVVTRETIELAFLVAIQHLPPRQRAVLVLRDVLGWPAKDTATALDLSVAAANSALQRARVTLREHLPERRSEWRTARRPTEEERAVVERLMDAVTRADDQAIAATLSEHARCSQAPGASGHFGTEPAWYEGRDILVEAWGPALRGPDALDFRFVPTVASRQPALGIYIRPAGTDDRFEPFGLDVLRIEGGEIVEITGFGVEMLPLLGLPAALDPDTAPARP